MRLLFFLAMGAFLFSQEEAKTPLGNNDMELSQMKAAALGAKSPSDIMIVDPKVVAGDWKAAFERLMELRSQQITFVLENDQKITGVTKIDILPGGYLMFFSFKSVQGNRYQIVKTGEIRSIVSK